VRIAVRAEVREIPDEHYDPEVLHVELLAALYKLFDQFGDTTLLDLQVREDA
jgi:hypothetical protein